jgi:hypothetical protein
LKVVPQLVAILACIVVAAFLVYCTSPREQGPLGEGLEIDASNLPPAASNPPTCCTR